MSLFSLCPSLRARLLVPLAGLALSCGIGLSASVRPASAVPRPPSLDSTPYTPLEQRLLREGYLDIARLDTTIRIDLMYARLDNFTGRILYTRLSHAFLHPHAAKALVSAARALRRERPDLRLLVCDAGRPMSIQQQMWDAVKDTPKYFYVSNPAHGGGLHNYGLAVDITLCDAKTGRQLDMGTPVDHMGKASHIDREAALVASKAISATARRNRLILRRVMQSAGFMPLRTEWWHFNYKSRAQARRYYRVIP